MKILFALGFVAVGCSSPAGSQTISGRVAQSTFASPVDTVTVVKGGTGVLEAPVAADGSFTVIVPAGSGYRIELSSAATRAGLVSPRSSGAIDVTFAVRGSGAPFDLGMVRYVGDPAGTIFKQTGGTGGDGDGECEDGIDPATHAVCVDDDEEDGGSCSADEGDGDGEEADDGEDGTDDGETDDDGPAVAAVADHNLPSAIGCDDDHENEGEEEGDN